MGESSSVRVSYAVLLIHNVCIYIHSFFPKRNSHLRRILGPLCWGIGHKQSTFVPAFGQSSKLQSRFFWMLLRLPMFLPRLSGSTIDSRGLHSKDCLWIFSFGFRSVCSIHRHCLISQFWPAFVLFGAPQFDIWYNLWLDSDYIYTIQYNTMFVLQQFFRYFKFNSAPPFNVRILPRAVHIPLPRDLLKVK